MAACRYYSSEELKGHIAEAVKGLLATQDSNGYIGTYTDSKYFGPNTWNIWGRKYTLWGLLEAWELLGDDSILSAACRFTDHLMTEVGPGHEDIIQTGQFYGIPSTSILKPIIILYRATCNSKYLEFAKYIVEQWSKHPEGLPNILHNGLSGQPIHTWYPESEEWAKSYEIMSCVEELLELYRETGVEDYFVAAMGFILEDNVKMSVTQITGVKLEDALPHKKAVTFFRGPIALARDIRLGQDDIFTPLSKDMDFKNLAILRPIVSPAGIWKAYKLHLNNGKKLTLCYFASAGNTWDESSKFNAWNLIE